MNERLNSAVAAVVGKMKLPPSATNYEPSGGSGKGRIARLRDRHHTIARMVAKKIPDDRICSIMGMTQQSLDLLKDQTPAFQELVWHYEQQPDRVVEVEEYLDTKHRLAIMAQYELSDRLIEDPSQFSPSELVRIIADNDDRTGYSKQSVTVSVHAELGVRLDAMRRRNGPTAGAVGGGGVSSVLPSDRSAPPLLELSAESARSASEPEATHSSQLPAPTISEAEAEVHRHLSAGRSKPMPHAGKPIRRRV